jgi:hypothetical protein
MGYCQPSLQDWFMLRSALAGGLDSVREFKLSDPGARPLIPQRWVVRALRSDGFVLHNRFWPTQHFA